MWKSLWRLSEFAKNHAGLLLLGVLCFLGARIFEAQIPLYLREGIDRMAAGNADVQAPVLGIIGAVMARFLIVSAARYAVRQAGLRVAFDARTRLFSNLQHQGSAFFNRYGVGDMMTRAVADISLIQRLFSMGTILLVILLFATVVGFYYMWQLSPELTFLILPPMPFVVWYAYYSSREMGISSLAVQERMSQMSQRKNFSNRTKYVVAALRNDFGFRVCGLIVSYA